MVRKMVVCPRFWSEATDGPHKHRAGGDDAVEFKVERQDRSRPVETEDR